MFGNEVSEIVGAGWSSRLEFTLPRARRAVPAESATLKRELQRPGIWQ